MSRKKRIPHSGGRKPAVQPAAVREVVPPAEIPPGRMRKLKLWMALIVALTGFSLYVNSVTYKYTLDDGAVISNNTIVKQGLAGIPELIRTSYWKGISASNVQSYRPLSMVMFATEWHFFPDNPHVSHLVNVLLYTLTGFILFYTLSLLLDRYTLFVPFVASMLFMAHPVHTEVVASIKSRDEILTFLFLAAALYFLLRAVEKNTGPYLIYSCIGFFLALVSKENAITFLAVAPFALFYFRKMPLRQVVVFPVPLVMVAGVYMLIRALVLDEIAGVGTDEINRLDNVINHAPDFVSRFASAMYVMGKYLLLLLFPHPLVADYSYQVIPIVKAGDPRALISIAVYGFLIWFALKNVLKKDAVSFGIIYFLATIFLVSNLVLITQCAMAERFLYMPSLGFCIIAALVMPRFFKQDIRNSRFGSFAEMIKTYRPVMLALALVFTGYAFKTVTRSLDWKDNYALFSADVKTVPNSARVHFNLGAQLMIDQVPAEKDTVLRKPLLVKAEHHLLESVRLYPEYFSSYLFLGACYFMKNEFQNALNSYLLAKRYSPKDTLEATFYFDLGNSYGKLDQFRPALDNLMLAARLKPKYHEAYTNIGYYYGKSGKPDSAIYYLKMALDIEPENELAYNYLGSAYGGKGMFNEAIEAYRKAISINPEYGDVYNNLGTTYGLAKDYPNAIESFRKAVELEPDNAQYHYYLGLTYQFAGDTLNARKEMEIVSRLNSGKN